MRRGLARGRLPAGDGGGWAVRALLCALCMILAPLPLPAAGPGAWGPPSAAAWAPDDVEAGPGSLHVRVHLPTPPPPGVREASPPRLERVFRSGSPPPRHRSALYAPGLLLVIGYDEAGAECWRGRVKDPRPVRVEATPDPGRLSPREAHRDGAAADVVFPGDCPVHRLEFFEALWTGAEYRPSLLGSVEVPRE